MLLRDWRAGDKAALDALVPIVYDELHRIAGGYIRRERAGQTLRATDLVSEAYLRLVSDKDKPDWRDRIHFFAIAARRMRQILVEQARKRHRIKRGSGERAVTFDDRLAAGARPAELVALDAAIEALVAFDERKAQIVEMHYFAGLTQEEIAEAIGVHVNTVARQLRLAEAWIQRHVREAG
jgi:RNA polymerase sigma factor (TIGR02999 family)